MQATAEHIPFFRRPPFLMPSIRPRWQYCAAPKAAGWTLIPILEAAAHPGRLVGALLAPKSGLAWCGRRRKPTPA